MVKKWWHVVVYILIIVVVDQVTKFAVRDNFMLGESISVIDGLFSLTYVQNTGAAFGVGAGKSEIFRVLMFLMIPVFACGFIMYLLKGSLKNNPLLSTSYALILGGALGNLIDRFYLKFVVDMFDFYLGNNHFPAFNIADSAITIAAFLFILDTYLEHRRKQVEK